jgi:hypothetical protein
LLALLNRSARNLAVPRSRKIIDIRLVVTCGSLRVGCCPISVRYVLFLMGDLFGNGVEPDQD